MTTGMALWIGLCILVAGPSMGAVAEALKEIAAAMRERNYIEKTRPR